MNPNAANACGGMISELMMAGIEIPKQKWWDSGGMSWILSIQSLYWENIVIPQYNKLIDEKIEKIKNRISEGVDDESKKS